MVERVTNWIPATGRRSILIDGIEKLNADLDLLKGGADRAKIDEKAFLRCVQIDFVPLAQKVQGTLVSLCDAARRAVELTNLPVFEGKERYQAALVRLARTLLEIVEIKRSWSWNSEDLPESILHDIRHVVQRSVDKLPEEKTNQQRAYRSEWRFCSKSLERLLNRPAEDDRLQRLDSALSDRGRLVTPWHNVASEETGDVYYDTFILSWWGRLSRDNPAFFAAQLGPILAERQRQEVYLPQIEIMPDLASWGCDELWQQAFDGPYGLVSLACSDRAPLPARAIAIFHLRTLCDHPISSIANKAKQGLSEIKSEATHVDLQRYLKGVDREQLAQSPPPYRRFFGRTREGPMLADSAQSPVEEMSLELLYLKRARYDELEKRLAAGFAKAHSELMQKMMELRAEMSVVNTALQESAQALLDSLSERKIAEQEGLRAELVRRNRPMEEVLESMAILLKQLQREQAKLRAERKPFDDRIITLIRARDTERSQRPEDRPALGDKDQRSPPFSSFAAYNNVGAVREEAAKSGVAVLGLSDSEDETSGGELSSVAGPPEGTPPPVDPVYVEARKFSPPEDHRMSIASAIASNRC